MQQFIEECLKLIYELQWTKGQFVFSHGRFNINPEIKNQILFYVALQDKRLMLQ